MTRSIHFVELCAGAAAVSLRLLGGPRATPIVSWMGGKRRQASGILAAMGLRPAQGGRVLMVDAGPWGWVWRVLRDDGDRVAEVLRGWEGSDPRALWEDLASKPPAEDIAERTAGWLWLQARSASGVPVWWGPEREESGWRMGEEPKKAKRRTRTASQCGGGYRSADHDTGRTVRAGQTGHSQRWVASDGRGVERPAGQKGRERRWGSGDRQSKGVGFAAEGGIIHPATIADRIDAVRPLLQSVEIHHGDVAEVKPHGGAFVYVDPPYVGCTGYGWDLVRERVLAVARRWAEAGSVVAVSETVRLDLEGWHHVDLTPLGRSNARPEWLTMSQAPVVVPAVQLEFAL